MATKKSKKQATSSTEKRPAKRPDGPVRAGWPYGRKKIVSLAEYEAQAKAGAVGKTAPVKDAPAPNAPTAGDVGAGSEKSAKAGKPPKERKPSGLDAAAQVLAEAGEPIGTKEMVERMLAKGLWKTGGKTPAATIYAAIIREISVKGDKARFRKTERGRFELVR